MFFNHELHELHEYFYLERCNFITSALSLIQLLVFLLSAQLVQEHTDSCMLLVFGNIFFGTNIVFTNIFFGIILVFSNIFSDIILMFPNILLSLQAKTKVRICS